MAKFFKNYIMGVMHSHYTKNTAKFMSSCTLCKKNMTYLKLKYIVMQTSLFNDRRSKLLEAGWNLQQNHKYVSQVSSDAVNVPIFEIKSFLKKNCLSFEEGHTCLKLSCPICQHELGVKQQKKWGCLYINRVTGMFICYVCKHSGSWHFFQDVVDGLRKKGGLIKDKLKVDNNVFPSEEQLAEILNSFQNALSFEPSKEEEFRNLLLKFEMEHFKTETFLKFNVKAALDCNGLLFPYCDPHGTVVGIHSLCMELLEDGSQNVQEAFLPKSPGVSVFGWPSRLLQKEVVLTASPADAMAVKQETNKTALSLPKGISTLPLEVLPLFENFSKIYIWFGNTLEDWEAAKMFSYKLGRLRCYFLRPKEDHPSPRAALNAKWSLTKILKDAQPVEHKSITTFSMLRKDVLQEFEHVDKLSGIKWKRFPGLNQILKGHRRGEVTIFTGPTGSGKTTFISEYSIDLCAQGVKTLWGSFEISNTRLARTMLKQFSLMALEKNLEQFDVWADKFEELSLYFMTFHGQQSFKHVIDAMEHAVYVHDIQHVVLDNLQFMMGLESQKKYVDRFYNQDVLIAGLRKFATHHNCHVTLVVHPRKERDTEDLTTSSIFGSAKVCQEADNVLILQVKNLNLLNVKKFVQVTKNRFGGDMGVIAIDFDKDTHSFSLKRKPKKATRPTENEESRFQYLSDESNE